MTKEEKNLVNYKTDDNYYYRDDDAFATGIMFMKMSLPMALRLIWVMV